MNQEEIRNLAGLVNKLEKDIPKGHFGIGGSKRCSLSGGTYFEGTSIPYGDVEVLAIWNKSRKESDFSAHPAWIDSEEHKLIDLSKGAIIRKEVAEGGENYHHFLFYTNDGINANLITEFKDNPDYEIIPLFGESSSKAQVWHSFFPVRVSKNIHPHRRIEENTVTKNYIVIPFHKTYECGFPNPSPSMEDGLIYYNKDSGITTIIEKTNELSEARFIKHGKKINIKKDTLSVDNKKIIEASGFIDIIKTEGNNMYLDVSEIIDFYGLGIGATKVYERANPTNKNDPLLKKHYAKAGFQAGPQMIHNVYLLNTSTKELKELGSITDGSHKSYEYFFEPTKDGVKAVSRYDKKEHNFRASK